MTRGSLPKISPKLFKSLQSTETPFLTPTSASSLLFLWITKFDADLNRGERTAAAMESQLTALEQKLDDLLASAESQESEIQEKKDTVKGKEEDEHEK